VQAHAVQINFSGGTTTHSPLIPVFGDDGIGDAWEMRNGPALIDSMLGMADYLGAAQSFNSAGNSSGRGTFANSFQLTLNSSQTGGFAGILTAYVPASGLTNNLTVKPTSDPATWVRWIMTLDNLNSNGRYQQILFTSPLGTQLSAGQNFSLNVNFAGVMSNTSGWSASWDDRAVSAVPEPETYAMMLAGLGLMGFVARRRKQHSGRFSSV
jgi:hypothetical protein